MKIAKVLLAFAVTVFLTINTNSALAGIKGGPPPEAEKINGLYYWEGELFKGGRVSLVALLRVDFEKPMAYGNIFLEETPILLSSDLGETPVAISIQGGTLWFTQKEAMRTYAVAHDSTGKALYTRYIYFPKPGESRRQDLGELSLKKIISLSDLTSEETKCADVICMKNLRKKYFEVE